MVDDDYDDDGELFFDFSTVCIEIIWMGRFVCGKTDGNFVCLHWFGVRENCLNIVCKCITQKLV